MEKDNYEEENEGYGLSKNASRTNQAGQSSRTSIKQREDDINAQKMDKLQQQQQQQRDYNDVKNGGSVGDDNQSDYDSPVNDEGNDNITHYEYSEKINDKSEEYDEDAQFYVSGEDCHKSRSLRKLSLNTKKLEPLVESANENIDGEYEKNSTNGNNVMKQCKRSTNLPKRSPYEINGAKVLRKKSPSSITTPTIIPQTKKSAAAAAVTKSLRQNSAATSSVVTGPNAKIKLTTNPPSPAMLRLKQRNQLPLERSKKVNLLKKHSRRNPMGSPPPPPTVSPSTSGPHTPSINASDLCLPIGSSNAPMSHKGVSAIRNSSKVPLDENDNDEDDEDTFRADKTEFIEVPREDFKKASSEDNFKAVVLTSGKFDESKHSPLTLYTGTNPYTMHTPTAQESTASSSHAKGNCSNDSTSRRNQKPSKVEFDETVLLNERDQYLSLCMRNPLYSNPKFSRPWNMFTRLSENLTEEILQSVQSDFANGVDSFVDDFLHLETTI